MNWWVVTIFYRLLTFDTIRQRQAHSGVCALDGRHADWRVLNRLTSTRGR